MIRISRQSEFLAPAEILDRWVMARERAIATLGRKAAWLAGRRTKLRPWEPPPDLRHAAFEERRGAFRLRKASESR
ncbi:hypothetical protein [Microvirga yunnanensis]|uniref:hypothetical protein n=1 Tax=Microvirga yunnanensis TaxID=2953740 RepID=UPI0021CA5CC0|nr:hypothetical protein [Microvirga sp. HBU65207]